MFYFNTNRRQVLKKVEKDVKYALGHRHRRKKIRHEERDANKKQIVNGNYYL